MMPTYQNFKSLAGDSPIFKPTTRAVCEGQREMDPEGSKTFVLVLKNHNQPFHLCFELRRSKMKTLRHRVEVAESSCELQCAALDTAANSEAGGGAVLELGWQH